MAVSDFSGLASSDCALASAAAIAPIVSLDRCMARLPIKKIEADRAGLRAFGANAVAGCFLGVLGHQPFQLRLGALVFEEGGAGRAEQARDFGPGIGFAHVDDPNCLDPRRGWFDAVRARLLPSLDAAPETLLAGQQEVLVQPTRVDTPSSPWSASRRRRSGRARPRSRRENPCRPSVQKWKWPRTGGCADGADIEGADICRQGAAGWLPQAKIRPPREARSGDRTIRRAARLSQAAKHTPLTIDLLSASIPRRRGIPPLTLLRVSRTFPGVP